ncbi:MAG: hypothetical protein ACRDNZ_13200, partial [Streptosporangiaceae bacterium]
MSAAELPPGPSGVGASGTRLPRAGRIGPLTRAALSLYPPAWQARYGAEVRALLEESSGGLRAAASLAWRAVPAWLMPAGHLHDGPARMR